MSNLPIKPVNDINSHLLCAHCGKLFSNPVINVHCGHSFCKECALTNVEGNHTKCPIDAVVCSTSSLVINRALVSQIDDIRIHCQYGLVWDSERNDYTVDSSGCKEIILLGTRRQHEDICEYIPIPCPNNAELCGTVQQKNLKQHLLQCKNKCCCHQNKDLTGKGKKLIDQILRPATGSGCEFKGTAEEVSKHVIICGFRSLQVVPANVVEFKALEKKNGLLEEKVQKLTNSVSMLQEQKLLLESKLDKCEKSIQSLDDKYNAVWKELERTKLVRRTPSAVVENKPKLLQGISRTPSQSSVAGNYSSSITSPKSESWAMPFQFKCIGTLRGHADIVWCLRTKGSMLYSCGDDKSIKVWDLEALEKGCKKTIRAHDDQVHTLAVGAEYLYSGGGDGSLKAWNCNDGTLHKSVQDAHNNIVAAMVCTEDYLFTSSHTLIKVWDVATLEPIHTIQGLHHWVRSLALSKTQEKLYSGSHNTIEIWETIGKFKLKGKITHSHGSVHSLAVTKSFIIAGTYNNNIHVFDVGNHDHIQKLSGHIGIITSVTASPSGRFLFTASSDKTITVWNLENMLPIHTLSRHEGSVNSLVLYHDLLLSGSEDTEIKVFNYSKMQPGFVPS